ncbi:hypothetical protein Cgig2_011836 [Carnegiea gigantea]|uniref:Uncharacterized protein n=1 Tax=Carnegiea gigantea TaxID=171969 RepID=A0A9Q1JID1_9CARY|nr:hypothetical protein Cgig2_011836 [Carnegiea gigantea]
MSPSSKAAMAGTGENSNATHSVSSGEVSVENDVGIDSEKGDSDVEIDGDDNHDDASEADSIDFSPFASRTDSSGMRFAGFSDRNWSSDNIIAEESSPSNKSGESKHHSAFSSLLSRLFDEKIPLKKKLKWLTRLGTVKHDGTVQLDVPGDMKTPSLDLVPVHSETTAEEDIDSTGVPDLPPMQIVMLIVGTRGDVQPFVAIGKRLQWVAVLGMQLTLHATLDVANSESGDGMEAVGSSVRMGLCWWKPIFRKEYGHRVRLATHSNFKEFVLTAGLEFFPLGGDPKILAGYMVKNKGFLPSDPSEIPIQRKQIREIIFSLLPACQDPDPESKVPFKAEAIIANPPAYGHVHVAEALKVPIHIFFTMPWTPTSEFPHPLSRVKQPIAYRVYWGLQVDVVGFCFLDLASNYKPPDDLVEWLAKGQKPIYIGFGSLPVQEPEKMTKIIVRALELTDQRGIINKGWGGLGNLPEPKDFVYTLDNVPHDWLFLQCSAVVHHGGAGTTAAGLKAACPTTIVPFFGDQPFWGERVHAKGIGPASIPIEEFCLEKLVAAIRFMQNPKVKQRAVELAKAMENEDGVTGAVNAFYKHLPQEKLDPDPDPPQAIKPHRLPHLSLRGCFLGTH